MVHISGMKNIGIAKKCLAFLKVKGVLVDLVEHFSFFYIGELDLRMPVPQKGAGFIAGKPLVAYQEWEGAVSVFFQFFSGGICDDLQGVTSFLLCADSEVYICFS